MLTIFEMSFMFELESKKVMSPFSLLREIRQGLPSCPIAGEACQ